MSESARKDSPEQAEFRQYCKDWLADNRPGEPPVRLPLSPLEIMTTDQLAYLQAWQKAAYDAGLVGCDYPVEFGGGGREDCQRVANEEMIRARSNLDLAVPIARLDPANDQIQLAVLRQLDRGEQVEVAV